MSLTPDERRAAIRLANHQREEQGVPAECDDLLLLDRIATLLSPVAERSGEEAA